MKLNKLLAASAVSSAIFLSACANTPEATDSRVTTESLIGGGEWIVEDIGGNGIIDSSRVSIVFMEDNQVGGSSSCNRYSGEYQLNGSTLTVGDNMASTRMACPPALMNQEESFLKLLMDVNQARFGDHGELLLSTPEGETIRAFQSSPKP
ncbi:META domain-containing protein [uncultured Marinobacter sp.]|uniref:META domain-containing protein n=1 Tax=uncultured Marinobacter sp. TaxID=187379 RepID=UPI00260D2D3C|nr:META domain-containing protein [uncultured Marinobacter sp.]